MTPAWMAIRSETTPYEALQQIRTPKCCDSSGLERKIRKFLSGLVCPVQTAVRELSAVKCIEGMSKAYRAKGGCDNTASERIISIMTTSH